MKKLLLPFAVIATIITASSCKKNDTPASPQAQVMFINACINTTSVNAQVNATDASTNIAVGDASKYMSILAADSTNFFFYVNTSGTQVGTVKEVLTPNQHYTVVAGGTLGVQTSLIFTSDDLSAPSAGHAKVRFINASADNTAIEDVTIPGIHIGTGVQPNVVTPFVEVPADTANVLIANSSDNSKFIVLTNQNFQSGKIYTIVFTGIYSSVGTNFGFLANVVNNN